MVRDLVLVYIGVGANLGDSVGTVNVAIERLGQLPLTQREAASSLYRSAPVDASGPDFINAVLAIKTGLNAYELLANLQHIELACGNGPENEGCKPCQTRFRRLFRTAGQ